MGKYQKTCECIFHLFGQWDICLLLNISVINACDKGFNLWKEKGWLRDERKLTFFICQRTRDCAIFASQGSPTSLQHHHGNTPLKSFSKLMKLIFFDNFLQMCSNIFMNACIQNIFYYMRRFSEDFVSLPYLWGKDCIGLLNAHWNEGKINVISAMKIDISWLQ